LSEVPVEAPQLELSPALNDLLAPADWLALWLKEPVFEYAEESVVDLL